MCLGDLEMLNKGNGRIIRQGNENPVIHIFRYVTKQSFDAYSWQIIERKQKFISQVYRGDTSIRKMDDMNEGVLNSAEIKAIASGNPLILEKFKIDTEVNQLKGKERNYKATKYRIEDNLKTTLPESIQYCEKIITNLENDKLKVRPIEDSENCTINFFGKTLNSYKEAGEEILKFADGYMELNKEYTIGNYRGFNITITNKGTTDLFMNKGESRKIITIQGDYNFSFDMLKVPTLNVKKLDEKIDSIDELIKSQQEYLKDLNRQKKECETQLEKPFEYEEKLQEMMQKQKEINEQLHFDKEDKNLSIIEDEDEENEESCEENEENNEEMEDSW